MLVRTAVDSSALPSISIDGSATFQAMNRRLVNLLFNYAVLSFATQDDLRELLRSINALPQQIRKMWMTGLPEMARQKAVPPVSLGLSQVASLAELSAHWRGRIEVAYVDIAKARQLGVPPNDASTIDPGSDIEVARIDLADEAERFQRAAASASSDVPRNADRESVWDERFRTLAEVTKTVTIVDRYAVDSLLKGHAGGLQWFFAKLDSSGPTSVHLIAQGTPAQARAACAAVATLQSAAPRGNIRSLSLTLADKTAFAREAHTRHVRLGPVAIQLDRGLAMFHGQRCGQSTPCFRGDRRGAVERETRIEQRAVPSVRRQVIW